MDGTIVECTPINFGSLVTDSQYSQPGTSAVGTLRPETHKKTQQRTAAGSEDDGRWEPSAHIISADSELVNRPFGYRPKHAMPDEWKPSLDDASLEEMTRFILFQADEYDALHRALALKIKDLGLEEDFVRWVSNQRDADRYYQRKPLGGIWYE